MISSGNVSRPFLSPRLFGAGKGKAWKKHQSSYKKEMDCEVNKSVFKGLIELNLIELPDYKRPHEADRVGDLIF